MDVAEEEQDVRLQKASSELLADLQHSLSPFLWKKTSNGKSLVRRRVRVREAERLLALLEPFQELPQLLDPHLGQLLPTLADALLEYLRCAPLDPKSISTPLLMPLSEAICKLLYTFCKIRGEKIIVRFFGAETRHLELLLSSIEAADALKTGDPESTGAWGWEERYVVLLWLSHLLLVPFDLATISSAGAVKVARPEIPGLVWPPSLPGVSLRVIPIAMKYLESAGKERDAAKVLLVRISMRKDMQELGLLHSLVNWALMSLQSSNVAASTYYYIGVLSYLAGVLVASSSTSDMDPYLSRIFNAVQSSDDNEIAAFRSIHSSALARKTVIKVMRTIAVLQLRGSTQSTPAQPGDNAEIIETTIGIMLEALADNDTPVRLAASKALSIITQKLAPTMAAQVVEAVIDSLNHNVLWITKTIGQKKVKVKDLSAVNPLEWHGLILTLSQLLYRRSPPPDTLSGILHSLLIGLSFERRSTTGSSIGTNVRDAACFGIWALARRYTTAELQAIDRTLVTTADHHDASSSIIQVLATELVVAASLDSAGNIRRGASAALQELIGRHPDTVENGIAVVQTVDYHRVALRSKAMDLVVPDAAKLSRFNEEALLSALFGWRGIGDGDPVSRRNAALCVGTMASLQNDKCNQASLAHVLELLGLIKQELENLKPREVDQRHGLLLALAAVLNILSQSSSTIRKAQSAPVMELFGRIVEASLHLTKLVLNDAQNSKYRRPELIAEATCRVISAACEMFKTDYATSSSREEILPIMDDLIETWLSRKEPDVLSASVPATISYVQILDSVQRTKLFNKWLKALESAAGGFDTISRGHILAIGASFDLNMNQEAFCTNIISRWDSAQDIDTHIALLEAFCQGSSLVVYSERTIALIIAGLDDYTADARGDIGSGARLKALQTAGHFFAKLPRTGGAKNEAWEFPSPEIFGMLFSRIMRLSVEKLDKVRTQAQATLSLIIQSQQNNTPAETEDALKPGLKFRELSSSSYEYFTWILQLQIHPWLISPFNVCYETTPTDHWIEDMLEGFVTSADTGSEGLIRVSRAALVDFCFSSRTNSNMICEALVNIMKKNLQNDRVLVPTIEVMSFLFDARVVQQSNISFRSLFVTTQKAHFKSGNVRKLESSVKLYGGLLDVFEDDSKDEKDVLKKLASMLFHPFPAVRTAVVDVLWIKRGVGKGVDWTKARKEWEEVKEVKRVLGIQ